MIDPGSHVVRVKACILYIRPAANTRSGPRNGVIHRKEGLLCLCTCHPFRPKIAIPLALINLASFVSQIIQIGVIDTLLPLALTNAGLGERHGGMMLSLYWIADLIGGFFVAAVLRKTHPFVPLLISGLSFFILIVVVIVCAAIGPCPAGNPVCRGGVDPAVGWCVTG